MFSQPELTGAVEAALEQATALRRNLHENPELSTRESGTAAQVAQLLRAAGLDVTTGVGGHGVIALIGSGAPCLAVRADMDALPVQEAEGLPYASRIPGVMHACGHDYHTAWLAGVGLAVQRMGLPAGTLKLIFQPAEETIGGAEPMIGAGVLENPHVDALVGAHVSPDLLSGQVALRPGPNLAAADKFTLRVEGAGTHGASPHRGRDPIPVAAEIVLALQALATRRIDPLSPVVVSVCQINAGSAFNIIPPQVELAGTVRTLFASDRDLLEAAIGETAAGIAQAHGLSVEYTYQRGVPPTVTDPQMTALAREALQAALGAAQVLTREKPSMGAEDFALFLQQRPGALLWVGCAPDAVARETMSLHHPHFCADENCLKVGMLSLLAIVQTYFAANTQ